MVHGVFENSVTANHLKVKSKDRNKCLSCMSSNLLTLLTVFGVFGGIALGAILRSTVRDHAWPQRDSSYVGFVGELFLRMLKGLILPLIVSSLISAVGSMDLSLSRRIGGRAICFYLVTTIGSVILGIILVTSIRPGAGSEGHSGKNVTIQNVTTVDTLLDLVRNMFAPNLIQACIQQYRTILIPDPKEPDVYKWEMSSTYDSNMNILGLMVFAIIFGISIAKMGKSGEPILNFFTALSQSMMIITQWVIWLSPIGVMFLICEKVLEMDDYVKVMEQLGLYFVTVVFGLALQGFILLPLYYFVMTRKNPITFLANMAQALATAFGTASSAATLPIAIKNLEENNGIDPRVARFVMPIGSTINMDGTALYEAVAALFIAQVRNVQLTFGHIIAVSVTATFASIGAAGIPQAGLVTMVMVLDTVGLPAEDVSLIIAVDWLLCSHSELPRVLEGLKSLGQYLRSPIDELILENNNLPSLPGRVFIPVNVMRLMLRNNGLERVSSDWLAGLENSLMELYVVEPLLRSFPEDSLDLITSLEAVTIQSKLLKRLPKFSELPKLRHLQIESDSLVELSPRHFRMLPALEKLHVTGSPRLIRLDNGLLQDLPRLNLINISFCGITLMHPRTLTRLPALTELILTGNKISDAGMVGRGTRELPSLSIIRLDHNSLERLEEASFVDFPSLRYLYLSNNQIVELSAGAFHHLPILHTLDLSHNIIRRIHPNSFLATGLEELWLVDNEINHISELRSILDALPQLVFLDLSNNHLQEIPFGALQGHSTLERLHLDHNKIQVVDREAFSGMNSLRELRLRNNSLSNLLDTPLWNLPSLKGLDLSQNYYRILEPRLLNHLPALRRIDFSENLLTTVDPVTFLDTPSLEHVNLSYNALVSLHPATFRNLIKLYELDVNYNKLIEFVPGLPRGIEYLHMIHNQINSIPAPPSPDLDLPALRMLDLSSNVIQRIPNGALRSLPQLRRFYLNNNNLESLEAGSLEGLTQLETLSLSNNKIESLDSNSLKSLIQLQILNLKSNRIQIIRPELLSNNKNLKVFDISYNRVTEIMSAALEDTKQLQIIDASYNMLTEMSPTFQDLRHLNVLNLTNNRIRYLNPSITSSLISLRDLLLSQNMIRELRRGSFENLQHLKTLHLDNNEVELMDSEAIRKLPALFSVKMNKNKLRNIPDAAFSDLPALQMIELQENELKSIGKNAFYRVPHLLFFNISHNELFSLEAGGLNSLRLLEVLDVSSNKLSRVTSSSLEKMEWLVELRLDNNEICAVHGSAFNEMPRLRLLSLKNNKMTTLPEHTVNKLRSNIAVIDINGNPLLCTCNLLWMQAWLREADLVGPHCSDGSLLRDVRLSRQDCLYEQRTANPVAPGCEAELLSVPPYGTSQIFSQWMDLKESTTVSKPLNMAPSPEESEYFYDEYVDYPYNESSIPILNNTFSNNNIQQNVNTPKKMSSHYISGDTPVLYAASNKNKSKIPDTPKGQNPTPNSSGGFTFFGVPLPALNLYNLWSKRNPTDRKSDRISTGPEGNRFPLSKPELQTGFVPILPETSGGFRPIVNPAIHNYTIERVTKKPNSSTTVVPSSMLVDVTEDFLAKRGQMNHPVNTTTIKPLSTTTVLTVENVAPEQIQAINDNEKQATKNNVQQVTLIDLTTVPIPTLASTVKNLPLNETKIVDLDVSDSVDSFEDLFHRSVTESTSTPVPTTTIATPSTTLAIPYLNKNTSTELKTDLNSFWNNGSNKNSPSTLSTFLIPGGQQPPFRTNPGPFAGRSTITKVISPHIASTAPLQADPVMKGEPKEEALSTTLNNDHKAKPLLPNTEKTATSQIPPHDGSMSWYFMNYNKTNLQPYVDSAVRVKPRNCQSGLSASIYAVIASVACKYFVLKIEF